MLKRLAINGYICPEATPFERFLDLARAQGAGAVSVIRRTLEELGVPAVRRAVEARGLAVSSVNSAGFFLYADADPVAAQARANSALIEAAAELEAGALCVITGGISDGGAALEASRARIAERFAPLAQAAARAGVRLALEPIHPADLGAKGCINSIAQALALTAPYSNAGLMLDLYHSWWDADIWALYDARPGDIAVLQFCNVIERDPEMKPGRDVPSLGMVDVGAHLRAAEAGGYRGWYEFEIFDHHLAGRTVEAVLEAAAADYRAIFEGAPSHERTA